MLNRVFKGNTPYRTSISTQLTVIASQGVPELQHSQNIASHFHGFRYAGLHAISLEGEGGMPLNRRGPPVNSSKYPKYVNIFLDSVTTLVKLLLQIVTILVLQIHILGLLEILR